MVYAVLYLQTVTTRNKTTDVHVMSLETGQGETVTACTRIGLLPMAVEIGRGEKVYHEAKKGWKGSHQNKNMENKNAEMRSRHQKADRVV